MTGMGCVSCSSMWAWALGGTLVGLAVGTEVASAAVSPPSPQHVLLGSDHPAPPCTAPAPAAPAGADLCRVSISLWLLQPFCALVTSSLYSVPLCETPAVDSLPRCPSKEPVAWLGLPRGPPCAHLPPCRHGSFQIKKMDLPGPWVYKERDGDREQWRCYDTAFSAPSRCGIRSPGSSNARAGKGIQTTNPSPSWF